MGWLSRIGALQMQQMSLATARRRKNERVALEYTLKRIGRGECGVCVECSEDIHWKRLEIDLVTLWCIGCASNLENP